MLNEGQHCTLNTRVNKPSYTLPTAHIIGTSNYTIHTVNGPGTLTSELLTLNLHIALNNDTSAQQREIKLHVMEING